MAISRLENHDGFWNGVPPILVEFIIVEGSFLLSKCYPIYILCYS